LSILTHPNPQGVIRAALALSLSFAADDLDAACRFFTLDVIFRLTPLV
jgi:hypothetical protein